VKIASMSILNKLSDVLKEVFWIRTSKKKSSSRPKKFAKKKTIKNLPKKSKPIPKKIPIVKVPKEKKPLKLVKEAPLSKTPASRNKASQLDPNLVQVGEITHYFERIKVCVVKITHGTVLIGDKLTMVGPKNKFVQKVWSMQVESVDVKVAKKGQLIGMKVDKPVAVGNLVYK
jgi:hypothetical protein